MAQINLERKRRSAVPWLLALLVLAVLLWWFLSRGRDERRLAPAETAAPAATAARPGPGSGPRNAPAGDTLGAAAGTRP